jgi:hypothetical protein
MLLLEILQDGLNPYLELTLKPRKAISSVIRHLSQKWGRTSAAEGQLHLFPYTQDSKNISNGQCWSIEQAACNAGDLFAALGNPSVLRLRQVISSGLRYDEQFELESF